MESPCVLLISGQTYLFQLVGIKDPGYVVELSPVLDPANIEHLVPPAISW